jgi:hypothetical protein
LTPNKSPADNEIYFGVERRLPRMFSGKAIATGFGAEEIGDATPRYTAPEETPIP